MKIQPLARHARHLRTLCLLPTLLAVPITTHADYFINGEGTEQPFCEAILAALNKTAPANVHLPCISAEILKMPEVKDPAWAKLELSQHEDLAMKMNTLNSVGSAEYFRKEKAMPQMYPTREYQERVLEGERKLGAELFALRLAPEFFGDRVLVTLRYKNDVCGQPSKLQGEAHLAAWVTPDLTEIASGPGVFDSRAARPLIYHGRLYLVRPYGTDQDLEVFVPRRMYMSRICNISYAPTANKKGEVK
jgi:hypothetical protein